MIVADANVVTYLMVDGPFTEAARAAFGRDADWRLPTFWRHEFCNAMLVLARAGQLTQHDAARGLARGLSLFRRGEHDVHPLQAFAVAIQYRLSAYDAHYVALAQALGVRCLTEDRQMLERVPGVAISLAMFIAEA